MCKTLFELQDMLDKKMLELWQNRDFLSDVFKIYFKWKIGTVQKINKHHAKRMQKEAIKELEWYDKKHPEHFQPIIIRGDNPWECYIGYDKDMYLVASLVQIKDELDKMASKY